ncbi:MAG: hypothetical protein ACXAEU_23185 [Candidatus Hodarchaeales archaeon]|jgi:hypothetical protein
MMTDDEKIRKRNEALKAIIIKYKEEILESINYRLDIVAGSLTNALITNVIKNKGAGGKTYVVNADFQTEQGIITGGIVLKYAKDLRSEQRNATDLAMLCSKRQREWDKQLENQLDAHNHLSKYPEKVFAPKILGIYEEANCIILEFINNCIPLIESTIERNFLEKLEVLGYSLGRLHGQDHIRVETRLYEPIFVLLKKYVSPAIVDYWKGIIIASSGGVEYIHGDSHLHNILRSGNTALAWIDGMMVPNSERMDDIGYALSYIIQEEMRTKAQENVPFNDYYKEMIDRLVNKYVPVILTAYKRTADITKLYKGELPLDFFFGSHMIIRGQMFPQHFQKAMIHVGKYFIDESPVNHLLKSSQ